MTLIEFERCTHFDVGGEIGTFKNVKLKWRKLCAGKTNEIYLSHWDYDHFVHIPQIHKYASKICWAHQPKAYSEKKSALRIIELNIPNCRAENAEPLAQAAVQRWSNLSAKNTNDSSAVFTASSFLMPGDSPSRFEKTWLAQLPGLEKVRVLLLSHHGSRNGTGSELLAALINLKMTVASARFAKYKHPHPHIQKRSALQRKPLLRTEVWGHIHIFEY